MAYCLVCGRLRATSCGLCQQCRDDERDKKTIERKTRRAIARRDAARRERRSRASRDA